jgi:hypothetical protein
VAEETKTVVTERAEMKTDRQLDSVTVVSMPPWKITLVRAVRVYLQTLLALLTVAGSGAASAIGVTLTAPDFWHVLLACASIAVAPAAISLIQNSIELLAKLDATNPSLRA